jgi:prepilin-type N-terminal cleavage/methylation domain-containing protein
MMRRRSFTVAEAVCTSAVRGTACTDAAVMPLPRLRARAGLTLLELLVVCVVAAVLIAISGKGISSAYSGNSRTSASRVVGTTLFQARAIAIQRSAKSTLVRVGNTIKITADSLGTAVQLGKTVDLNQRFGVTLSSVSVPPGRDDISFDARGSITGTTTAYKIIITKGSLADTVCVTGLGNTRSRGC